MYSTIIFIMQCIGYILFGLTLFVTAALIALKIWLQPYKRNYRSDAKLDGKIALITGGNSGIGLETARDLARRGATVVIASRDETKSQDAVKDIIRTTGNLSVYQKRLDLANFSSIREFAEHFNKTYDRLDILVNNAGCAGLLPSLSEDGIEKITQINYVGPFLLTNLLLDKLIASKPSRIVILSSKANEYHDFDENDIAGVRYKSKTAIEQFKIYANSKLCDILWTKALAKRLPVGVTANAVHPGVVLTNIYHRCSNLTRIVLTWIIGSFFKKAEEGAQTSIYLCVAPELDNVTGEYFFECAIEKADKLASDKELIDRVWEKTMMLIKEK